MEQTVAVGNESTMFIQIAAPHVEPPNDVDLQMEISKLKNGKASGHDQNRFELVKVVGKELKKVIHEVMSKIWE
jgi:hypothetical protein